MSPQTFSAETQSVTLARPGVPVEQFHLPPGARVGDLLREAKADLLHHDAMIGERTLAETDLLPPGSVVFLVPRPTNALADFADEILKTAKLTPEELKQEIALMLFQKERLTLGQASRLSGLGRLRFQRLLASRQIPIHYDMAEYDEDLKTLRELGRR